MLAVASAVLVLSGVVACTPTPPANATATPASAPAPAAAPAAAPATAQAANGFSGSIAETMDSGGYTYAKLKGEIETQKARISSAESAGAEVTTLREERDLIKSRVTEMLQQLDGLNL